MNLIKGRIRLFCVSNIIASFACTGFLGPRYLADFQEPGRNDNNGVIAADEVIPLSQMGEGESNIIKNVMQIPSIEELAKQAQKNNAEIKKTSTTTAKTSTKTTAKKTVTTSVVTKKEVKTANNYAPAVYSEVTGSAVVNYAKRYLGLRYVHAGRSLATGTDCSGFTSLIYKEFGISLPKTVSGQISKGTYVKKSDLQKGDLVFFSSGTSYATHVTMYIGDGKVIHESTPRDGVKISPLNMQMRYITARRVINSTAIKIVEQKLEEEKKSETNTINTNTSNNTSDVVDTNIVNNANTESISNNSLPVSEGTTQTSTVNNSEPETVMDNKKEDSNQETAVAPTEIKEEKNETSETVKVEPPKEEVKVEPVGQVQTGENTEN